VIIVDPLDPKVVEPWLWTLRGLPARIDLSIILTGEGWCTAWVSFEVIQIVKVLFQQVELPDKQGNPYFERAYRELA
jgi:hypothetical protein